MKINYKNRKVFFIAFLLLGLFGIYLVFSGYFNIRNGGLEIIKAIIILGIAFVAFLVLSMLVINVSVFVRNNVYMFLRKRRNNSR